MCVAARCKSFHFQAEFLEAAPQSNRGSLHRRQPTYSLSLSSRIRFPLLFPVPSLSAAALLSAAFVIRFPLFRAALSSAMYRLACNAYASFKRDREQALTLVFLGLDNAGKSATVAALMSDDQDFLSPTMGFACEKLHLSKPAGVICTMYDLGGGESIRGYWESYFPQCHAAIFVVDSAAPDADMTASRIALAQAAYHPHLRGKPVYILANKQDIPNARSPAMIASILDLPSLAGLLPSVTVHPIVALRSKAPGSANPYRQAHPPSSNAEAPPDPRIAAAVSALATVVLADAPLISRVAAAVAEEQKREAERRANREARLAELRARRKAEEAAEEAASTAPIPQQNPSETGETSQFPAHVPDSPSANASATPSTPGPISIQHDTLPRHHHPAPSVPATVVPARFSTVAESPALVRVSQLAGPVPLPHRPPSSLDRESPSCSEADAQPTTTSTDPSQKPSQLPPSTGTAAGGFRSKARLAFGKFVSGGNSTAVEMFEAAESSDDDGDAHDDNTCPADGPKLSGLGSNSLSDPQSSVSVSGALSPISLPGALPPLARPTQPLPILDVTSSHPALPGALRVLGPLADPAPRLLGPAVPGASSLILPLPALEEVCVPTEQPQDADSQALHSTDALSDSHIVGHDHAALGSATGSAALHPPPPLAFPGQHGCDPSLLGASTPHSERSERSETSAVDLVHAFVSSVQNTLESSQDPSDLGGY
jgi:signal recognition particle receptor subunit beta